MTTTGDARRVGVNDLRGIIIDSDELAKGTRIFDEQGVERLARYNNRIYGEAKSGMGGPPYRVALTFGDGATEVKARCTCMAARSRPFCKHAAALLIAWARAPEAFVVSDTPPPIDDKKKAAAVKRGNVSADELRKEGVAQVGTLVRELGAAGIASLAEGQLDQIRKLGEGLRENKLVRLGARALDLALMVEEAAAAHRPPPAVAYADLLADLLLTARKLEKHLGGEPLDPRHVEELIGKRWQKTDLTPKAGLDLVEYAYLVRVTSDEFIIRESLLFDLVTGAHYSEKQILPAFLKNQNPKPSRGGSERTGARGNVFPGYPPVRIDFTDLGDPKPLDHAALARLVDKALPDVASALAALQEHRRDVFAPDLLPVALRVDSLLSRGDRMQAVDATGSALHLPIDVRLEDRLGTALHEGRLVALIGHVGVDAALPTLWPLAAILEGSLGLELRTLVEPAPPPKKLKPSAGPAGSSGWVAAARAAGASAAAITLGEVREELADALVLGLAAFGPRTADPLAARLRDLALEKQAALLQAIAQRGEPAERLEDFIKLYQVLGIALLRLAGATYVDRATTERVPTYESVFVKRPEVWYEPAKVAKLRGEGALNRYEAAVHYARYYTQLPAEQIAENIYPIWADGSVSPYVVRVLADKGERAVAAAKKALLSRRGRVAKITAIRVLEAVGSPEAEQLLAQMALHEGDAGLRALAENARDALDMRRGDPELVRARRAAAAQQAADLGQAALTAPDKDARVHAIEQITINGYLGAIPALRQVFLNDAPREVREEAALALGLLGDIEMAETFVRMLAARDERAVDAKLAARALRHLGDMRGLYELLAAWTEGFHPKIIGEAIHALGPAAIEPLLELVESRPELVDKKPSLAVFEQLPDQDLAAAQVARLKGRASEPSFADLANVHLKIAGVHPDCRRAVAKAILGELSPVDAQKPLFKAAKKALN